MPFRVVALRLHHRSRPPRSTGFRWPLRICGRTCRQRLKCRLPEYWRSCCDGCCRRRMWRRQGRWPVSAARVADERVTTAHRAKLAYVYVRQSSLNQVRQHQESTQLQYRLVDRTIALGWPHERVQVIDEDLGKSGAGSVERYGFQKLIAEIGLGNAGLVVSLDASRLARNNRDWHQLLELCSVFGVLIADGERLYDPRAYHDRLLLGLSGIMSEAELHQIRMRLHQGERQKAARGELRLPLPAGTASAYIFGAICPKDGKGAALVMPRCDTEAMNLHLAEIATQIAPGAHAALLVDQAGWHFVGPAHRAFQHHADPVSGKVPRAEPAGKRLAVHARKLALKSDLQ